MKISTGKENTVEPREKSQTGTFELPTHYSYILSNILAR